MTGNDMGRIAGLLDVLNDMHAQGVDFTVNEDDLHVALDGEDTGLCLKWTNEGYIVEVHRG